MKHLGRIAATLSLIFTVSSCATAVRGRKQEVSFWSDPAGASVIVDGANVGTTPASVELTRHDTHAVRIEKPGYVAYEMTTERVESNTAYIFDDPWAFLPPLLLVAIPLDYYLGGMYEIKPTEVTANLIAAPTPPSANAPAPASSARVTSVPDANRSPAPTNNTGGAVSKSQ